MAMGRCWTGRRWLALGAVVAMVWGLAAWSPAGAADGPQAVDVDGSSGGRTFEGFGGVSAGAASRLLIDYPPAQRSQILDYLFKPSYGASLQMLKVEVGGDANSTDGTEPSHMRSATEVNCDRGYEWWLMKEAKARNPEIKLAGLEWGAPGWVGAGSQSVWTSQNITYYLAWLDCARKHRLRIDYLGGWNEKGFDADWFKQFRRALDAKGYSDVQIVADDGVNWDIADAMANDPELKAAVGVVGVHYPCGFPNGTTCKSSPTAQALNKPLWASEQTNFAGSVTVQGVPLPRPGATPDSYDKGAAVLAGEINRAYTDGRMTGTLMWSLVWSAYEGLPFPGSAPLLANSPWSGNYVVGKTLWAIAHTTQFARPGWRYLDGGSARLAGGGSVVTLRSSTPKRDSDWTSVIETSDASESQELTYQIRNGLSTGTVHVWATNLESDRQSDSFQRMADIQPQNGSFSLTVRPGYVYSLTTTTGQAKGSASSPPAHTMALPYSDTFDEYAAEMTPRYFADLGGSFQTAACIGRPGKCLQQQVTQQPVEWFGINNFPITVVGDPAWANYKVEIEAYLPHSGHVELDGRGRPPEVALFPGFADGLNGYHFRVGTDGKWSLYRQTVAEYLDPNTGKFEPVTVDAPLASGSDSSLKPKTWHRLGLVFDGPGISVFLDGRKLSSVADAMYSVGQVGLQVSPWGQAQFKNLKIEPSSPGAALMTNK